MTKKEAYKVVKENNMQKAKWIGKLMRSKSFIVVTDRESSMRLRIDDNFDNIVKIAKQKADLERFRTQLTRTINEIDKRLGKRITTVIKDSDRGKKIPVKSK